MANKDSGVVDLKIEPWTSRTRMIPLDKNHMIAYCGLDCSKCIGYLATLSGDEKELKKVAEIWSKQFNADVKPEHVICDGCKANKRKSYHCSTLCIINKCCIEKGYNYCNECSDFACKDVKYILDNAPEAEENLKKVKAKRCILHWGL